MTLTRQTPTPSPLADLEAAFRQATRGPGALAIDGPGIAADLPARLIALDELRGLLLHGRLAFETKDRVLGLVAARAQSGDDAWVVAFAGLLMPGLKRVARRLRRTGGVDPQEVGSEVVIGLLEALAHLDPCRDRIAASVCWEVYRRAYRATVQRDGWPLPLSEHVGAPDLIGLHPEEVLARAIRAGVLTPDDAELVACTRIELRSVSEVARSLGLPRPRLAKRRLRAEARVAELLRREAAGGTSDAHRSWCPPAASPTMTVDRAETAVARWRPRARLDSALGGLASGSVAADGLHVRGLRGGAA
jgi:hypothetical protein